MWWEGREKTTMPRLRTCSRSQPLGVLPERFYFPGVLIGPSTRFVDYRAWASGQLYRSKDRLPSASRKWAAAAEFLRGMMFMGAWMLLSGRFDYEALVLPADAPGSAKRFGFWGRVGYANLAGLAARAKYYGIWTLTNGACILSGLSYNGPTKDGQGIRWDRCKNINVLGVEMANNWKELLDNWNMNTNVWLRNNVYKRVARAGKKPGFKSTMATFITSAFWHGVAPGYYCACCQPTHLWQVKSSLSSLLISDTLSMMLLFCPCQSHSSLAGCCNPSDAPCALTSGRLPFLTCGRPTQPSQHWATTRRRSWHSALFLWCWCSSQ